MPFARGAPQSAFRIWSRTQTPNPTQQLLRQTRWTRTRWAIAALIAIGVLVALVLIVRDLGDDKVTEEEGTLGGSHGVHHSSAG